MQDDHVRHWGGLHPQPILPRGAPIGPRNAQAAPPLSAAVHIRPTVPEQGGGTKATCRGTDWPRLFVDQAARDASSTRCRRVHLVLQYGATGRLTRGTEHTPAGSARPWTATPFPCHRPRAQQLTARACSSMSVEPARRSTRIPARRCAQCDAVGDLRVKKYRMVVLQARRCAIPTPQAETARIAAPRVGALPPRWCGRSVVSAQRSAADAPW